ncbi:MAG: hypothetical protein AAF823_00885 [Planctomycetota bacterium]
MPEFSADPKQPPPLRRVKDHSVAGQPGLEHRELGLQQPDPSVTP